MPTVLFVSGWRFFFYSNESNEPIHIHARNGDRECKYWLNVELFSIEEVYAYNFSPRDTRLVRRIIFEHFDYIVAAWNQFHGRS